MSTLMQVELLMGRLTNVPAFLPFAWQRSLNGVLMGAIPHALENALGFLFDAADGSDYYARKRNELFRQRHPSKSGAATCCTAFETLPTCLLAVLVFATNCIPTTGSGGRSPHKSLQPACGLSDQHHAATALLLIALVNTPH